MSMQAYTRFTTNLSQDLFNFLESYSDKLKKNKRKIIEEALVLYKNEVLKKEMMNWYNEISNDIEEMDEWLEISNNKSNL